MGAAVLILAVAYVVVVVGAGYVGYRIGTAKGWSPKGRRVGAAVGALAVLAPVFWDWVPTTLLFEHYCERDAGLTVIQSPDQWRNENRAVAKTLVRQVPPLQIGLEKKYYLQLNQRFQWHTEFTSMPLGIVRSERTIVDGVNGRELVRLVDFSTGQSTKDLRSLRDIKVWMYRSSCESESDPSLRKQFGVLRLGYETMGDRQ